MAVERRKFPRVRADYGVKYKIKNANSPFIKAGSINIGKGGIMAKTLDKMDIGAQLELEITLPPPYGKINVLAEVIYALENYWDDYPPYRCGISFLEISKKNSEIIGKFVEETVAKLDWEHWL